MEEEKIFRDDAVMPAEVPSLAAHRLNSGPLDKQASTLSRLDSGFQSGGSLASCQRSQASLPASPQPVTPGTASLGLQQPPFFLSGSEHKSVGASSRDYNRTDSGLCEQITGSLVISDPLDVKQFNHPQALPVSPQPAYQQKSRAVIEEFFAVDGDGDCQLHLAIADGASEIVFALIRMAPDPSFLDIQNNEMYAPLHIAVLVNQPAMVRRLVIAGAQTDIRDREGNTPLHLAAKRGHKECAEALLTSISTEELKVDANSTRSSYVGPPALNSSIIMSALDASPRRHSPSSLLNLKNYNGEHCIHLATFGQHYELIWFLNLQQADVSSLEGRSGKTALHYAVNMGDERLVKLLATPKMHGGCGLWLNARDWSGRTALQCAVINGDENIANFLMSVPGCDTASLDELSNQSGTSDEDFEFDAGEDEELDGYGDIEVNGVRIVNSIA